MCVIVCWLQRELFMEPLSTSKSDNPENPFNAVNVCDKFMAQTRRIEYRRRRFLKNVGIAASTLLRTTSSLHPQQFNLQVTHWQQFLS